jgi:hypothetical protein
MASEIGLAASFARTLAETFSETSEVYKTSEVWGKECTLPKI